MNVKRTINELKRQVYAIMTVPYKFGHKVNANIKQQLRVDDTVLQRNIDGEKNIMIVQNANQTIYTQTNHHCAKMLEYLDNLENNYFVVSGLEEALKKCMAAGESWPELLSRIKTIYFKLALDNHKTHAEAARQIGIARTTMTEHFKTVRNQLTE